MENIPSIMQNLELELQRIRLLYLKWALERLSPPPHDFANLGSDGHFLVVGSPNGRAFRVSPCGPGVCYLGRPRGTIAPPKGMWQQDSALAGDTDRTRRRLSEMTGDLRRALRESLRAKNYPEVWRTLQDYWWMRLGMHELAYDVALGREPDARDKPVRRQLLKSNRFGEDLGARQPADVTQEALDDFIGRGRGLSWCSYAPCSYECGPIAVSKKDGFVTFTDVAQDIENLRMRLAPVGGVPEEKKAEAKQSIKKVLRDHYDLLLCYDDMPCYDDKIQGVTHGEFQTNKASLLKNVGDVEAGLRKRQEALQR